MKANFIRVLSISSLPLFTIAMCACGGSGSTSGGGNPPPPAAIEMLYGTSGSGVLSYGVTPKNGFLSTPTLVDGANGSMGIAATPSQTYLYTNDRSASGIDVYAIADSGSLTAISGSPFEFPTSNVFSSTMDAIAIHPSGKFLYSAYGASQGIAAFQISGTGSLTPIAGSPFPSGDAPEQVVVDPSGQFLFASNYMDDSGGIWAFSNDSTTGALTQIGGSPFPTNGPTEGLVVHPSGKFLYAGLLDGSIAAYSIDASTGALTAVQGSPFPSIELLLSLASDPKGKYLYAIAQYDGRIFAYSIDATSGALTPLSGSPFGLQEPVAITSMIVDPSGQFLYVAGPAFNGVLSYQVDAATGSLTAITPSGDPTGEQQIGSYPYGLVALQLP